MRTRDACERDAGAPAFVVREEPVFSLDHGALSLLWPLVEDERLSVEQRVALTLSLTELEQSVAARSRAG
ncbi:hypothetical protein HJD18_01675 [Thermoleophilia bacterium SCSIO 60948]|nr:hypothetical protein HJD18_01675 [Thermoleophilia bacterium SCSIO 60948]